MIRRAGRVLLAVLLLAIVPSCARKDAGFRHEGHVTIAKGRCAACHGDDPGAPRAASVDDCMACHREAIEAAGARGSQYSALHTGAVALRPPGYADIAFRHGPHVDAGVACAACHPAANHRVSYFPKMADCRACHVKEGVADDCPTCHRSKKTSPKN